MLRHPVDDSRLWRRAVRDVAPLRGREARPLPNPRARTAGASANAGTTPPVRSDAAPPRPSARPQPRPPLDQVAGIDRATAERLKRGRYPIEARLDLHGMTQAEAHRALTGFVAGSRAAGRRCLLIITGHGRLSGGVLKAAVPRWLGEPDLRRHVLALTQARPQAGGSGALYVLLRRERGKPQDPSGIHPASGSS